MKWVLVSLVAIVACKPPEHEPRWRAAGSPAPIAGGTLRFAAKDSISTLDPAFAYDEVSMYALHPLVDGLVGYSPDGTALEPRLAERWSMSPDGLEYRFTLRAHLRYADGAPIVAADLERGLERVLTTKDSPFGGQLSSIAGAQDVLDGKATDCTGITARGDHELEVKLASPNRALLYVLAMPFASPVRAGHPIDRRAPTASGPYELVAWEEGQKLEVRRRANYHDPSRQRIDTIVLLENVPRDLQFMMFQRGELDVAERLTGPDYLWIRHQSAWAPHVRAKPLLSSYGMRMNTRVKPFDDRRVRQALNYAIDKQRIVKLLLGTAVPSHGILPPGAFGRDDTIAPYPHDPAKARALLAEAGYAKGLELSYMTIADEDAEKVAASMQQDLRAVGVTVELSLVTFATWATASNKLDGPAFSMAGWISDYPDPTSLVDPLFHSRAISNESSTNNTYYANPELDRILDAARAEPDDAKRAALYRRAERILYDDVPWIWGYHQMMVEVMQPYVVSHSPHPVWVRDYTTAWLDVGPDGQPVAR